jgi:hypothetical protein
VVRIERDNNLKSAYLTTYFILFLYQHLLSSAHFLNEACAGATHQMPTPSIHEIDSRLPPFTSCPPEDDRETSWRVRPIDPDALIHDAVESAMNVETPTNLPLLGGSGVLVGPTESYTVNPQQTGKQMDIDEDGPLSESLSPVSTQDTKESSQRVAMTDNYLGSSTSTGYEASNIRVCSIT